MNNHKIHIQINGGAIQDAESVYGLYMLDCDSTLIPESKDYERMQYPETDADEIDARTTYKSFDYKMTMLMLGLQDEVQEAIIDFYASLFSTTLGSDIRTALPITVYNEWTRVKVTGYAKPLANQEFHPNISEVEKNAFKFDFVLDVSNPKTLQQWQPA